MKMTIIAVAAITATVGAASAQDTFGDAPATEQPAQQQQPYQPEQPQPYQQQPYQQQPQPPLWGGQQQPTPPQQPQQDQITAMERQDFGVQPTNQLHSGPMHGPTPASIPGGQVITTQGVLELMQGRQAPYVVLDILGGTETLPGATFAVPAHQAGSFSDTTQQEFGQFLQQTTKGDKQTPLILYCQSTQCWMSYNASLRAINLGYTNVLWYRGGVEAWKASGQQMTPVRQQTRN
jgi:rhodanese-related sulfurtransferase